MVILQVSTAVVSQNSFHYSPTVSSPSLRYHPARDDALRPSFKNLASLYETSLKLQASSQRTIPRNQLEEPSNVDHFPPERHTTIAFRSSCSGISSYGYHPESPSVPLADRIHPAELPTTIRFLPFVEGTVYEEPSLFQSSGAKTCPLRNVSLSALKPTESSLVYVVVPFEPSESAGCRKLDQCLGRVRYRVSTKPQPPTLPLRPVTPAVSCQHRYRRRTNDCRHVCYRGLALGTRLDASSSKKLSPAPVNPHASRPSVSLDPRLLHRMPDERTHSSSFPKAAHLDPPSGPPIRRRCG
ncbi:hypothetical protein C8F01DRAFT_1262749 [Mycena amicta]|nr:hypothetical protein C8F01DRAFT_1262749 [Mycena amicta]